MKLLYISRHTYIQSQDGAIYSTGMMGNSYFEKYLRYFDTVSILGYLCNETKANASKKVGRPIQDTEKIRYCLAPGNHRPYRSLVASTAFKKLTVAEIQKADAVVCKSASAAAYAAAYAKKYHKPYMIEVVGCVWDSLWNHSLKGKALAVPSYLSLRSVIRKAPFVLYVTTKFLQKRYPTVGQSAGISDVELVPADDDVLERRLEKICNHTGNYRLGTAGGIHLSYKGQQYVIEALAKLKKEGMENFEYHLAGGGERARLSELADRLGVTKQVIFDGSIPHDEMFAWLDTLDIYLQPSATEGMPRALIEAMSRGLPAFGSRVGGIPELLGDVTVFPVGDTDQIAQMLAGLTETDMEKAAVRNFEHAKQFQKNELERQRDAFYSAFADAARRNNK